MTWCHHGDHARPRVLADERVTQHLHSWDPAALRTGATSTRARQSQNHSQKRGLRESSATAYGVLPVILTVEMIKVE